ncbi:winged helix-turn-helix domain-containing protein [archaeon]
MAKSIWETAVEVLKKHGQPMHYTELSKNVFKSHDTKGKTPWQTLNAQMNRKNMVFQRFGPGIYGLVEWKGRNIPAGEKYRGLWPLPGGTKQYVDTLFSALRYVKRNKPKMKEFVKWFLKEYGKLKSPGVARSYIYLIKKLGFIKKEGKIYILTDLGKTAVKTRSYSFVFDVLDASFLGVRDLLQRVKGKSSSLEELNKFLKNKYGTGWKGTAQALWRTRWLISLGALEKKGGNYFITKTGEKLLSRPLLTVAVKKEKVKVQKTPQARIRRIVGKRTSLAGMSYEPVNEKGVIFLFGYYLKKLGFSHVEAVQAGFPDATAIRPIGKNKLEEVRIEFEFKSSNFKQHKHIVQQCDLIVCWQHDWKDCPLDVIELKSKLEELEKGT